MDARCKACSNAVQGNISLYASPVQYICVGLRGMAMPVIAAIKVLVGLICANVQSERPCLRKFSGRRVSSGDRFCSDLG